MVSYYRYRLNLFVGLYVDRSVRRSVGLSVCRSGLSLSNPSFSHYDGLILMNREQTNTLILFSFSVTTEASGEEMAHKQAEEEATPSRLHHRKNSR